MVPLRSTPPFVVPAREEGTPSLRFIAVGDVGTGDRRQRQVADAMAEHTASYGLDFVLLLGDNFYEHGVRSVSDELWETTFERVYHHRPLQVPFHPVIGNHDLHGNVEAQIAYSEHSGRWTLPARYYAFSHALGEACRAAFFALETESISDEADGFKKQLAWLERELERAPARWKIVYGHHPIRSTGRYGNSASLQRHLQPILLSHGVDLYLSGHDHHLALMKPEGGLHLVISGAGADPRSAEWTEDVIYARADLGFVWVRASCQKLVVEFVSDEAEVVYAHVVEKPAS